MSYDMIIGEKWIGKCVEESRSGPICNNIPAFARFEILALWCCKSGSFLRCPKE
jgi:hypothetical protein